MLKLQQSDKPSFSFWLVEPKVTIGRAANNDIVLDDHSILAEHAAIFVNGEQLQIAPTSEAILVNGKLERDCVAIATGDKVRLGSRTFVIVDPKTAAAVAGEPLAGHWQLLPKSSSAGGRALSIFDGAVIGRADACDIQISDPHLSRRHARVFFVEGKPWLEDLGSANGTFVNGSKVKKIELQPEDTVCFEKHGFILRYMSADLDKTSVRGIPAVTEQMLTKEPTSTPVLKSAPVIGAARRQQRSIQHAPVQVDVTVASMAKPQSQKTVWMVVIGLFIALGGAGWIVFGG